MQVCGRIISAPTDFAVGAVLVVGKAISRPQAYIRAPNGGSKAPAANLPLIRPVYAPGTFPPRGEGFFAVGRFASGTGHHFVLCPLYSPLFSQDMVYVHRISTR